MKLFLVKFTVSSSTYMNDDERDDEYTRMVEAVDEDHVERIIKNQPEFKTDEYSVYRRVYFNEITTVLRDSSKSSPDKLPADMEALVHALDAVERIGMTHEDVRIAAPLFDAVNRSRDLLKAYQEQRRALMRISAVAAGDVETDTLTTATGRLNGVIAIANGATLNQKGDER
jgi:hypothetical protein